MIFTKRVGVFWLDFLCKFPLSNLSDLNISDHKIYKCILIFRFPRTIRVCFRLGYMNKFPLSNLKRLYIFYHTIYNKNLPFCFFRFCFASTFSAIGYSVFLFSVCPPLAKRTVARGCRTTSQRLGAGGASTAVRTGDKLPNLHKLSGEPPPRLRQTAR
jgi:hypothetical protein